MSLIFPPPPPELNHILVVDDEPVVLTSLRETLRREGYEVRAVLDPLEALGLLQKEPFSVILSDEQMPGLTGLELLGQAKQLQPNTTRILVTALFNLSTVVNAINQGEVYRFIIKPWLREELVVTLANAVQRYELLHRNTVLHQQTLVLNEQLAGQLARLDQQNRQLDQLNQALHENLDRSVQLCLKTMETFSPLLGSQARRVHALCTAMADGLGLAADQRQVLEISARLHDIGLLQVPRQTIRKWQLGEEPLSEEESALIDLHPVLGQELAGFVADLLAVGRTIRAHHERFDGEGYPDRLAAEDIPFLARLLAVAVAYTTAPVQGEAAFDFINSNNGTAFDPEAVRAFSRSLRHAALAHDQHDVLLSELRTGMVLAKGIYTCNGILLLPEGQTLSDPHLELIRNHNRLSPITHLLIVYG